MKNSILLLFVATALNVQAGISEQLSLNYQLQSTEIDSSLTQNEARFTFDCIDLDGSTQIMQYSVDGINYSAELNNNSLDIRTTPGKHIFQFFYSENFFEVYTDSLEIEGGFHSTYDLFFYNSTLRIMSDKPVIYLYPEIETEVEVKVNIQGNETFFYPSYVDSWKFVAAPSGELTFGTDTYNYLFWEGEQTRTFTQEDFTNGFVVKKANVISFLEDKLTQAGLNSKEQADFITYWGPRLAQNELNFIHFEFNEECNRYAELNIEPKPENIFRIYIVWMPIEKEIEVTEQKILTYSRDGFSVLEWGGSEVKQSIGRAVK